jgi:hypothetical protein
MARPVRIEFEGAVYHVTSRSSARQEAAISMIVCEMENGKRSERTKGLMNTRLLEGHTKTKDLTPAALLGVECIPSFARVLLPTCSMETRV